MCQFYTFNAKTWRIHHTPLSSVHTFFVMRQYLAEHQLCVMHYYSACTTNTTPHHFKVKCVHTMIQYSSCASLFCHTHKYLWTMTFVSCTDNTTLQTYHRFEFHSENTSNKHFSHHIITRATLACIFPQ
jgi:hypothetical protein